MRQAQRSARGLLQILIVLALASMVAQASTLTYYIDIFGNSGVQTGVPALGPPPPPHPSPITLAPAGSISPVFTLPKFQQTITGNQITQLTAVQFLLYAGVNANAFVLNTDPNSAHSFTNLTAEATLTVSQVGGGVSVAQNAMAAGPNDTVAKATVTSVTTYQYSSDPADLAICGRFGSVLVTQSNSATVDPSGLHMGQCAFDPTITNSTVATRNVYNGLIAYNDNHLAPGSSLNLSAFESLTPQTVSFTATAGSVTVVGTETAPANNELSWGGGGNAGGVFEIVYTYSTTTIPEPATMILIGSSMLGIGLAARRKFRKS